MVSLQMVSFFEVDILCEHWLPIGQNQNAPFHHLLIPETLKPFEVAVSSAIWQVVFEQQSCVKVHFINCSNRGSRLRYPLNARNVLS